MYITLPTHFHSHVDKLIRAFFAIGCLALIRAQHDTHAIITAASGFCVARIGIRPLFAAAALLNLLGAVPYLSYLKRTRQQAAVAIRQPERV